jgi:hypothetical protein
MRTGSQKHDNPTVSGGGPVEAGRHGFKARRLSLCNSEDMY